MKKISNEKLYEKGMGLKMKNVKIISCFFAIIFIFIAICGNVQAVEEKFAPKVEYTYNEKSNTVTAKIVSNVELKDTKPTWTLSKDKLIYTKSFDTNQTYTTSVTDVKGNKVDVKIAITQIKKIKANITVEYQYNQNDDTVTAKIKSDIPLKDTKPTWSLSSDKLTYTKIFTNNQTYTTPVVDSYDNKIDVSLKITQVQSQKPKITVEYKYDDKSNQVTATMISNRKLKDTKPTWTLSSDGLKYTKVFKENSNYSTSVVDIYGNETMVNVKITQVANSKPTLTVSYEYDEKSDIVTAYIKSNRYLQDTKPTWELSDDKLTYKKIFTSNTKYSTGVVDSTGNKADVTINVTQIKSQNPKINVTYQYNESNNTVTATISSNRKIKNTKPTWKLAQDQLIYTKTFESNQTYTTPVEDIYGNKIDVKIAITQVKSKPTFKVNYNYNINNTVTVNVTSNKKFKDTKPTWKLSTNLYTYTKTFSTNTNYNTIFEDEDGIKENVNINVTSIKNMIKGIDVSSWNGDIDWAKVKNAGIQFAIIRAGFRGYGSSGTLVEDPYFVKNIQGAQAQGIKVGVYFFSQAVNEVEAVEEANYTINLISKYKINYPVIIDTEYSSEPNKKGRADSLSKDERTKVVKAYCDKIKRAGYIPMIYANKYWLNNNLNMSSLSEYDVWLAHYTSVNDPANNRSDYTGPYVMWQHTSSGKVNGIDGNVDLDLCWKTY